MVEKLNIDWAKVRESLPYQDTDAAKAKRKQMWKGIDVNGNGFVSLAEVDKGLRDVIRIDDIFDCKPAIMRAFQAAKNSSKSTSKHGPDYIELKEFKYLLYCLRQYFEYYQAFARVDTGDDNRIDLNEFVAAKPMMEKWVGPMPDPEAEFKKIDSNHGGQLLFDEFLKWAYARNLDLEDDDD